MFNWHEDESGYCQAARDYEDAAAVANVLGIPLHRADFSREYRDRVFAHFLDEYAAGRTPNPDVLCNREIKFGVFLDYARRLGADAVATGHYARVDARGHLYRGIDPGKDQSYFLAGVAAAALRQARFPLGGLHKAEVRELARRAGFDNHAKKDSTGICFVGERPLAEFLGEYLPDRPGPIRAADTTLSGEIIGEHRGLMFHTLGQRRGLGIGGRDGAGDAPWYVVAKDQGTRTLWVAQDPEHDWIMRRSLHAGSPSWIGEPPALPWRGHAQIRYRQRAQPCRVTIEGDGLHVRFDTPQRAIAPGQYAAFFDGDRCLGAAVIERLAEDAVRRGEAVLA